MTKFEIMVMERILKEVVFQSYGNQESASQAYGENSIHGIVSVVLISYGEQFLQSWFDARQHSWAPNIT